MNPKAASRMAESTTSEILRQERIDDYGYRTIGGSTIDSLNPVGQETMMQEAHRLWLKNPIANSIIELFTDFALGDGYTFNADDEAVQDLLTEYWEDRQNDWENKFADRFRDLCLNGELILKPSTLMRNGKERPTGKVKIENVYPDIIKGVARSGDRAVALMLAEEKKLDIMDYDEVTDSWAGDVFFYQINKTTHASRGVSDLFNVRDWLTLYDKSLYATMERTGLLLSFVWDVTIKGASEQQLREKWVQIQKNPPKPGGTRVHNETETWEEKTPNLAGRDFESIYRMLKSQIIGGSRQPEHYFGMGGDVNLATASVMNRPYIMKVKRRQRLWKKIISDQFDFAISKAKKAGVLSSTASDDYTVNVPEPDKDIAATIADSVLKFAQSLSVIEGGGYIDKKTANAVVKVLIGALGVEVTNEVDADDVVDAVADAAKKKADMDAKLKGQPPEPVPPKGKKMEPVEE